jgi:hypothetical protein
VGNDMVAGLVSGIGFENYKSLTYFNAEEGDINSIICMSADVEGTDYEYNVVSVSIPVNVEDIKSGKFDFNNTIIPDLEYAFSKEKIDSKELVQKLIDSNSSLGVMSVGSNDGDISRGIYVYENTLNYTISMAPEEVYEMISDKLEQ